MERFTPIAPGVLFLDCAGDEYKDLAGRMARGSVGTLGFSEGVADVPNPWEHSFFFYDLRASRSKTPEEDRAGSLHEKVLMRSVYGPNDLLERVRKGAVVVIFCNEETLQRIRERDYRYNPFYWLETKIQVHLAEDTLIGEYAEADPVGKFLGQGETLRLPLRYTIQVDGATPLAKTRAGHAVACLLRPGEGRVYFLPEFENNAGVAARLLEGVFPAAFPELYPGGEVEEWLASPSYDLPEAAALRAERLRLKAEMEARLAVVDDRLLSQRKLDDPIRGLLYAGSDPAPEGLPWVSLAACTAKALEELGFNAVRPEGETPGLLTATCPEGGRFAIACVATDGPIDGDALGPALCRLAEIAPTATAAEHRLLVVNPHRTLEVRSRPPSAASLETARSESAHESPRIWLSASLFELCRRVRLGDLSAAQGREALLVDNLLENNLALPAEANEVAATTETTAVAQTKPPTVEDDPAE